MALGTSLAAGGISNSGTADDATIVETAAGPVVAWLNTAGGVANVFVEQFIGWGLDRPGQAAPRAAPASPASSSSVSNLALTTDGTNVAVAWTQTVSATQQIYVLQYSGGTWNQLAGSASGNGISNSSGHAVSPSLAYSGGKLFAAWQDNASGIDQIYAAMFNGTAWAPAGSGANSGGGISPSLGPATQPALVQQQRAIVPGLDRQRVPQCPGQRRRRLCEIVERLGVRRAGPRRRQLRRHRQSARQRASGSALAVDPSGHPFVSWSEMDSGSSQIDVLGNTFNLGTIHYVNAAAPATTSSPRPRETTPTPAFRPAARS